MKISQEALIAGSYLLSAVSLALSAYLAHRRRVERDKKNPPK